MNWHVQGDRFQVDVSRELGQNNFGCIMTQLVGHLKERKRMSLLGRANTDLTSAQKLVPLEKC